MTPQRRYELDHTQDSRLTQEELDEGYRFCCEWDGMLIHKDDPEAEACFCLHIN
jgi:hypothetical protein